MKPLVFIDGDQGTTGLQILARLRSRSDLAVLTLPEPQRKDPLARAVALRRADFAVLCLPEAAARESVALAAGSAVRIVDASSAHRTDPAWTYGLPELEAGQAQRIAQAMRVSNPGCYPTGAVALLRPLVDAGLLAADTPLAIHAVSGYSGQGRAGVERHEGSKGPSAATAPAFELYGLHLQHKHVPEIRQHAGLARDPLFVPGYGHYAQGIVLTVPLHRAQLNGDAARVHQCLAERYAGRPNVTVMPFAPDAGPQTLDPQVLNGRDDMHLHVLARADGEQMVLAAVFDNLGKGAAGAAVQNLDLMLAARH
ncbi:MAG: N-acetyl-gamma-glutamyl-phosphate reductase [Rubrivivax sp.]|nr:N-acetyl-gamma-glutamyl-phosphate reductase [Rubrivivax sp.]